MANEKAPEADKDETAEAGAAVPAKKGLGKILSLLKPGKKMLLIGAPVLLLLLAGGGAGAWFFLLRGGHDDKAKIAQAAQPVPIVPPLVAYSDVPDILVNIQSSDGAPAYLKLSVSLELDSAMEKTGLAVVMPRLVDQFQGYLRELRVDDLKGSMGVMRLKEELLRRVNVAAAPYKVRGVLLKQMIVQ